jgi:hypothetical protein
MWEYVKCQAANNPQSAFCLKDEMAAMGARDHFRGPAGRRIGVGGFEPPTF